MKLLNLLNVWSVILVVALSAVTFLVLLRKKIMTVLPKSLFIIILVVSLLASGFSAASLYFRDRNDVEPAGKYVVSFVTNGGNEIPSREIASGGKVGDLPVPMKAYSSFTGWYTDEELAAPFYSDSPITEDTVLYASYKPTRANLKQHEDPSKYLDDRESDFSISVVSPFELTAEDLSGYITLTAYLGELPGLEISADGGVYTISPSTPYTAGGHYRFELLDEDLSFEGESAAVRTLDFRIYKDPVEIVELDDDIKYVLWKDVDALGDATFYVPDALGIDAGDTVCFWDGRIDENARFYNILLAMDPEVVDGTLKSLLSAEENLPQDILDELDIHFKDEILVSDQINKADLEEIALNVSTSEGTLQLTTILASAIAYSQSFNELAIEGVYLDGEPFVPVKEDEISKNYFPVDVLTENLLEGLTVTAYVAEAENENFYNAGPGGWTVLSLTFTYETTIKDVIDLNIVFTVTECVKSTAQGDAWIEDDYSFEDFFSSEIIPDMYFDFAINNYSQTDMDLVVLIKSHDASDDDYLDITKELEELTKPGSENEAAGFLEEVLGNKGDDYISLLDVSLISLTYPIIQECPVLQLNVDLNFVVKINFAAGISAHYTVMTAKQTGITGDTRLGADTYENTLIGNNRYTFDFYCAGYIGLKAGLKLSMSLSFYGLKDLGEVGFSGEIGAYLDIYGFVHFGISKLWQYSDKLDTSLQGGLYMELGIYVELEAFAKSAFFKVKASASLFETKIPLLDFGSQYVLLKFTDDSGQVVMNEDQFSLYGSAGLFDAEYVDMKTGRIVSSAEVGDLSDIMSDFTVQFSSPYLEYDDTAYAFRVLKDNFGKQYANFPVIPGNTKRLDAAVYIYYSGGNLAFSYQQGGDTMKRLDLTWIDPSIDIAGYEDLDVVKATYFVDVDGELRQVLEKWVGFGSIPGSVDYSAYVKGCRFAGYTNDPSRPILEDTVYTLHLERYQRLVSYLTYHDGSWHLDVFAAYAGDVPAVPAGYDSPGAGIDFAGWIGRSGTGRSGTGSRIGIGAVDFPEDHIYIDSNNVISTWENTGDHVYLGLDTTAPLLSVSGMYDECLESYYGSQFQGVYISNSSVCLYEAQYESVPFTVKLIYPQMSYTYCGQVQNYSGSVYEFSVRFNDPVNIASVISYAGYGLPEWDEDGDGTADHQTFAQLSPASRDITLYAIFKATYHTVKVLDADSRPAGTLEVKNGALPDIMQTRPVHPDDDLVFAYWAVSRDGTGNGNGNGYSEWDVRSDPGVFADWTIKPVYERVYDVTFDYMGGIYDDKTSATVKLAAGTYDINEIIGYQPFKGPDERFTYVFDGWSLGDSLTVSGDMTVEARYDATPVIYTTEFNTSVGSFVNGDVFASRNGDLDSTNAFIDGFLKQNADLETMLTIDKVYDFDGWEKIDLSETHVRYEAQWSWRYREYTVTFDAGDGSFSDGGKIQSIELPYGTVASLASVSSGTSAPVSYNYLYEHSGWKDAEDRFYGPDDVFTVNGDMTFTAQFTQGERILYTVTLNAAGGTFAGGESVLEFSGFYDELTGIDVADPARAGNVVYDYVFAGWSAPVPNRFTQTITILAQWNQVYKDYTITFDANGGVFAGGSDSVIQVYRYNDNVTAPSEPVKTEDDAYTYEFNGWNRDIKLVTEDMTYTATWRAVLKEGLPETGIIVSDGLFSEDINCNGAVVSGYSCVLKDQILPGEGTIQVPVLTIIEDGLTFSGNSGSVHVVIDPECKSVNFENLSLSGAFPYSAGILVAEAGDAGAAGNGNVIEIDIWGDCEIVNTSDGKGAVFSLRPIVFNGLGSDPSLTIASVGRDSVYSRGLETHNITLGITAAEGSDPEVSTYAVTGEGADGSSLWRFVDSNVSVRGMGVLGVCGSVVVEGDSFIDFVSSDNTKAPLLAFGEGDGFGVLSFTDFTGEFTASYLDPGALGPAVQTTSGIFFYPDAEDYDLGGSEVAVSDVLFGGMTGYYTFVDANGDGPSLHIRG